MDLGMTLKSLMQILKKIINITFLTKIFKLVFAYTGIRKSKTSLN